MRKVDALFTKKHRSVWQKREERRLISRDKARARRRQGKGYATMRHRRKMNKNQKGWTVIPAPEIFSIVSEQGRTNLNDFIKKIAIAANNPTVKIQLDFTFTHKMFADATLLFLAKTRQIHGQMKAIVLHCKRSMNPKINEVLTQIRLLEMIGQNFHVTPHHEDVIHWNLAEGKGADGEKYESVLGHYDGTLSPKLKRGFYLGVTEAMTNTRQHAYPNRQPAGDNCPEWWMFSQEKDNWLTVAFCDLGVGIPATLPTKKPAISQWIHSIYHGKETDAQIIEGAIKYGKTRTEKKYRGKGLPQLNDVIENAGAGSGFFIYSGKGCYSRLNKQVKLHNFSSLIGGTVITWRVPI